jgi:hypothetical protein
MEIFVPQSRLALAAWTISIVMAHGNEKVNKVPPVRCTRCWLLASLYAC